LTRIAEFWRYWHRYVLQRVFHTLERFRGRYLDIRPGDPLARRFAEFGLDSSIRHPWVALNNLGSVAIGSGVKIRSYLCIEAPAPPGEVILHIGDRVHVGYNTRFVACNGIYVEEECGIGHNCTISDTIHDWPQIFEGQPPAETPPRLGPPLRIERGAWVGNSCLIAGGLTIGARAIVAPNSVVTRDVPPQTMVSGNPARRVPFPAE
jgi:acetyltransferase-like isoleucine patch superfamily enzyme